MFFQHKLLKDLYQNIEDIKEQKRIVKKRRSELEKHQQENAEDPVYNNMCKIAEDNLELLNNDHIHIISNIKALVEEQGDLFVEFKVDLDQGIQGRGLHDLELDRLIDIVNPLLGRDHSSSMGQFHCEGNLESSMRNRQSYGGGDARVLSGSSIDPLGIPTVSAGRGG